MTSNTSVMCIKEIILEERRFNKKMKLFKIWEESDLDYEQYKQKEKELELELELFEKENKLSLELSSSLLYLLTLYTIKCVNKLSKK